MPPIKPLEQRVRHRLAELDTAGLRRHLRAPAGIDLSSNDYLGLAAHPLLKERMAEAVRREGCGSTASRLLRGERAVFAAVEQRFAAFKGTDAALYFGSGYAANLAALSTFLEAEDAVFSDELNHASLIDGLRLTRARPFIFSTAPPPAMAAALEAALTVIANEPERRRKLLERAAQLRELLAAGGVPVLPGRSQIIPVMIGDNEQAVAVAAGLQAEGFDVRAVRPPSVPPGTARLRLSVNVNLDEATMKPPCTASRPRSARP